MADRTKIAWADATWSPVSGCTKVSAGCANCYISRTPPFRKADRRFERVGNSMTTGIQLHPERLDQPPRWRKPRRIFVCSMSDLFHEGVPDEYIGKVFLNMAMADQHTFQVLTKRPERMAAWMKGFGARLGVPLSGLGLSWPLPNVWLGTSVENQYWVDQRLPHLAEVPAAVRFLSVEPLLKPVNLYSWLTGHPREFDPPETWPEGLRGSAVGWVIVGGESGPRHRPMEEEWVRDVRDQCQAAEVPFFFKQWGGPRPGGEALLDGRPWREWPEPILAGRYGSEDKP